MANNFHDINGWLIVGIEGHNGFHIFPPMPMWFWKVTLLHPFTLGDKAQPTVLMNGVPSVTHNHEPPLLWPHLGIIPDPLDAMTPLHILFGSHKCWLPRGAVEICGEKSTCCVIGGPVSVNADCWEYGKWPTSLVLDPGTVQTTPTVGDFLQGALTLAIDLLIDIAFEVVMTLGGALLKKIGDDLIAPLFKKGDEIVEDGLRAAAKNADEAVEEAGERAARDAIDPNASALPTNRICTDGHPVDLTSGAVVDEKTDISLPGAIPLVWKRYYSSSRALERTSVGRGGWVHSFEQWVVRSDDKTILRDDQGRDVYFRALAPGESAFHRADRLTLTALEGGAFEVYSHKTRLTRAFAPAEEGKRALLRSIQDPYGNAITLDYTGDKLRRVIDTAGRDVRVKMTHGGRIARLEVWAGDSLEQWVDYSYSKMGELAGATDCLGHAEHYGYDIDHRMVKTTLKNGVSFYYAYDDETGWCKKTWGDGGLHTVELAVDRERRVTRTGGNEEPRIIHWNEAGLVLREETPDGIVLRVCSYDEDQYLISHANGAGETTRYEYDERGNKVRAVDPAGNVTEWSYEDDQPVVRVEAGELVTRYEYDAMGALRALTPPWASGYSLEYDERGHLQTIRNGDVSLAALSFDEQHNIVEEVDARGASTKYSYDALGRLAQRTDALGHSTLVEYDRLGRPIALRRPNGTTVQTAYDALDNALRVTDALGRVTEMTYAGTGVLTRVTHPDGGVWRLKYTAREKLQRVENPEGESYEFAYDSARRKVKETTFDGRTIKYSYSIAGSLARIDYPDGSFRALSHDPLGNVIREDSTDGPITFERDPMGRLLNAVVEENGRRIVTSLERDRMGRVVAEVQSGRRIEYKRAPSGQRTARIVEGGGATHYRYDMKGGLVGFWHDGHELVIDRDILGRETTRRSASGRFLIQSEYDSMDRIIERRVESRPPSGVGLRSTIAQRLWQYDALGQPRLVEDQRWGATSYEYDEVGRLLEARRGARLEAFAFDAAGSILSALVSLGAASEAAEDQWQLLRGNLLAQTNTAKYAYDARGRRIRKTNAGAETTTEYIWDCRDQLREVKLPSGERVLMTYDAFGRRVRKEILEEELPPRMTEFLWDGDVLAADLDSTRGARSFVHAPGTSTPVLQAERGEAFMYVNDHLGTPKELIDVQGRVVWSATHSFWGKLVEAHADPTSEEERGWAVASPFRSPGQVADEETGLHCTRFRYFDPEVGRWCSPDPIGLRGGSNLFAWDGSPTTSLDPLGLSNYIFRADDEYRGGSIGFPLDSDLADNADIQTPWDHVQGKEGDMTSRYTSFSEDLKSTKKFGDNGYKVSRAEIEALEEAESIRVLRPQDVGEMMEEEGLKKKQIQGVLQDMKKNNEILIEGEIPADIIKRCS